MLLSDHPRPCAEKPSEDTNAALERMQKQLQELEGTGERLSDRIEQQGDYLMQGSVSLRTELRSLTSSVELLNTRMDDLLEVSNSAH